MYKHNQYIYIYIIVYSWSWTRGIDGHSNPSFFRDFVMTCPVDSRLQAALPPVRWDPHPSGRRSCPAPDLQVVGLLLFGSFDSAYYWEYCYYCCVIIVAFVAIVIIGVVIVVSCRRCYWYCCYSNPNSLESAQDATYDSKHPAVSRPVVVDHLPNCAKVLPKSQQWLPVNPR